MRSPIAMWNAFLHRTGLTARTRRRHGDRSRPHQRTSQVEPLEPRQMLTASQWYGEDFDDQAAQDFSPQAGTWTLQSDGGGYEYNCVAGGDHHATSTFDNTSLPDSFRMEAVLNADPGGSGVWSNAFLIFDYHSPSNYKFAGTWQGSELWVIGESQGPTSQHTLASFSETVSPDQDYQAMVWIEGNSATLYVDGQQRVSYDFGTDDLRDGQLGLGTIKGNAQFDDFRIELENLPIDENFANGREDHFFAHAGHWDVVGGEYLTQYDTQQTQNRQVNTVQLSDSLPPSYDFRATVRAETVTGWNTNAYLVFDYVDISNFKYAGALVGSDTWVIGEVVAGAANAIVENTNDNLLAGVDYDLFLDVDDDAIALYSDDVLRVQHVFTGQSLSDGLVGLGTSKGKSYFDDVSVIWENNTPVLGSPVGPVDAVEDVAPDPVDLSSMFDDDDLQYGDDLTLSVTDNDNTSLLTAYVDETDHLVLTLEPDQYGTASLTIRAVDHVGDWVEGNVVVDVAFQQAGDLIVNGGFEVPLVTHPGNWDIFSSIDGWSWEPVSSGSGAEPELHRGGAFGGFRPPQGYQYMEMAADVNGHDGPDPDDEDGRMRIWQDVTVVAGSEYVLRFDFAGRNIPSDDGGQNKLGVSVTSNGEELLGEDPLEVTAPSTDWSKYEYVVQPGSNQVRIEFWEASDTDLGQSGIDHITYGTLLDNVEFYTATGDGYEEYEEPDPVAPCSTCGQPASQYSDSGVGYADGSAIQSTGAGCCGSLGGLSEVGHTLIYDHQFNPLQDYGNGYGWQVAEWPHLIDTASGDMVVSFNTDRAFWYEENAGAWNAQYGARQTLAHDAVAGVFRFAEPDGTVYEFNDFDQQSSPGGLLRRIVSPGGHVTEVTAYTLGNRIARIEESFTVDSQTTVNYAEYTYLPGTDENGGRLGDVLFGRIEDSSGLSFEELERVSFEYYVAAGTFGSAGELKSVTLERPDGSGGWFDVRTHYFRYYQDGEADGFEHGLKFVLLPEAYRHASGSLDLDEASDAELGNYACYYYQYDANRRVDRVELFGGSRTYTYQYFDNASTDAANNWKRKTVETRPDGSTYTVYTNFLDQVLLSQLSDPGTEQNHISYGSYDPTTYRMVLLAEPTAVAGFNDQSDNLAPDLRDYDGLVHVYDYDSVSGNLDSQGIREGELGTEQTTHAYSYRSRFDGSTTSYSIDQSSVVLSGTNPATWDSADTAYDLPTYYGTSHQVKEQTIHLPDIPAGQNGPNSASYTSRYDIYGNLTWSMDERGFITYYEYDVPTGTLVRVIEDVDMTDADILAMPSEDRPTWSTPNGGGLHLTTNYEYDSLGRITQILGPEHNVPIDGTATDVRSASWTAYVDVPGAAGSPARQIWSSQGYVYESVPGSDTFDLVHLINPVSISTYDADGRTMESIEAVAAVTDRSPDPQQDTFAQSSYTSWAVNTYLKTMLVGTHVYHDIPATSDDPDADGVIGQEGTNYNTTTYAYDSSGRPVRTESPGGTITHSIYDARGLVLESWVGTDDSGGGSDNMVQVSANEYDGGVGGNGLVTKTTQFIDATTTREATYGYDFRDRRAWTMTDDGTYNTYTLYHYEDVRGLLERVEQYHDVSGDTTDPLDGNTSDDVMIGKTETSYDDRGRAYRTVNYGVDPSNGTVAGSLTENTWFDAAGNVIKSQAGGTGAFSKTTYDSLGRPKAEYFAYEDTVGFGDTDPTNVSDDTVFEQVEYVYDDAGNTIFVTSRQRHHDAATNEYGPLQGPDANDAGSRDTYVAMWYDPLGRTVATADYGTNGETEIDENDRPSLPPTRSDDVLVTSLEYDNAGRNKSSTDPAGAVTRSYFDDAGRVTKTVENYVDGLPTTVAPGEDIATEMTYNADGLQATLTAVRYQPLYGAPGSGVPVDLAGGDISSDGTLQSGPDGTVDANDIDALYEAVAQGLTDAMYDLDGDGGAADQQDVDALVRGVLGTEYGDLELDGDVDYSDLAYFAANFLQPGGWADGDFDGDGMVDWSDEAIFDLYFGFPEIPSGVADHQTTTYVYGSSLAESGIARSDLLRAAIYPDSDDPADLSGNGSDGTYDRVEYRYDRAGQLVEMKDQNETVHDYEYDRLGRLTADVVSEPGSDVYGPSRIDRSYEVRGLLEFVTTYSDTEGLNALNQVKFQYNAYGQVTEEYQEHAGLVDANTLYVKYIYVGPDNGLRLSSVRYPDGRRIFYGYGAPDSVWDELNRMYCIRDDNGSHQMGQYLTTYNYLGLSTPVIEAYAQSKFKLDYRFGSSGEKYKSLDRFGRVVDQIWYDYGHSEFPESYKYGYDRAGNRTYRENVYAGQSNVHLDELYQYDGANRLVDAQRGDLNATDDGIVPGTESFAQDWHLDALGNWSLFTEDSDGNGTNDLDQTRTVNPANEIGDVQARIGQEAWNEPSYNRVGNMNVAPLPSDPDDWYIWMFYDAWNRLERVYEVGVLVGQYEYDGLGRRIVKHIDDDAPADPDGLIDRDEHFYYDGVQVIEMREANPYSSSPESEPPAEQYVWSARYVDAPVLRDRNTDADGTCIGASDERIYYLTDANMNVTALVAQDAQGQWGIEERYVYDPYGEVTTYEADWSTVITDSPYDNDYLYTGRRLDSETGLYYYRARFYHAGLGTFVSRDPIGYDSPTMNLYAYVNNGPTSYIDPSGLVPAVGVFSGVNSGATATVNADNPAGNYMYAVCGAWLTANGVTIDDALSNNSLAVSRSPKGSQFDIRDTTSESHLDHEAPKVANDYFSRGQFCIHERDYEGGNDRLTTKIKVLMLQPKTTTEPSKEMLATPKEQKKMANKCCCSVEFWVAWAKDDWVANQGIGNTDNAEYWKRWGRVATVDNTGHSAAKMWNAQGNVPGTQTPFDPRPTVKRWLGDPTLDYVFICHSQGCNILMQVLNRACARGNS